MADGVRARRQRALRRGSRGEWLASLALMLRALSSRNLVGTNMLPLLDTLARLLPKLLMVFFLLLNFCLPLRV